MFDLLLARIFTLFYWFYKQIANSNLRGLGRALDLIRSEHIFEVRGRKFLFNPRVGRAYGLMIIGKWNEPETHNFLKHVIAGIEGEVNFVDVGASVGEFVIDMATCNKIVSVTAFEPHPESAEAIRKSCSVNGFKDVRVVQKIVTNRKEDLFFHEDKRSPTASHVIRSAAAETMSAQNFMQIPGTTLDDELRDVTGKTIVLMDVEGEEYSVIQGGVEFIRKWKPLLIFEYNSISRASFDLNAVRDLLGPDYITYRIRGDGGVDGNETNTWNMVAVAKSSDFFNVVHSLQYEG